jgi:hypothetical protein
MVIIQNMENNKYWRECGDIKTLVHWGNNVVKPSCKTVWPHLKKLNTELPCDLAIHS